MPKKKIPIEEREFVRHFRFTKGKEVVKGTAQPYIVGMYVAVNDPRAAQPLQFTPTHKQYPKWIKKLCTNFEKDGYKVETENAKYIDYIPKEELEQYKVI